MAADLDRMQSIFVRGFVAPRHSALDRLAWGVDSRLKRIKAFSLVAGRPEPGSLHRGVQLGAPLHFGVAHGALPGRVASLGGALGRAARTKLAIRATVWRRCRGAYWSFRPFLAVFERGRKSLVG